MMPHLPLAVLLTATLATSALRAQCDPIVTPFAPSLQLTNADGSLGAAYATVRDTNGDLLVGGTFALAGGSPMAGLARWDGNTWSPIATLGGSSPTVSRLFLTRAGELFVGGTFTSIGGVPANGAARRDANGWHAAPACSALVEDSAGNVYVNGNGVSRWDGVAWTSLAAPVSATALGVLANGDLVASGWLAGGQFPSALVLMRWDGATWTELQAGSHFSSPLSNVTAVNTLRTLRNGDLLVGGHFLVPFGNLAVWNSTGWHDVGGSFVNNFFNGGVSATAELPNGDLFVVGWVQLPSGVETSSARFDGTAWHAVGGTESIRSMSAFDDASFALCHVAGFGVGPTLSFYQSTCPAASASIGTACPSSGGNNELTADGLPWIGSTFSTHGTGLPTSCVVAVVNGFTTFDHPLANVLPMAAPSCEHRETMDMLDLLVTNNGTATWSVALPEVPALVGLVAYQQMFPLELDAQLQIVAASSTNTLRLQVGTF